MIKLDLSMEETCLLFGVDRVANLREMFSRVINIGELKAIPVKIEQYDNYEDRDHWFNKYQYESFVRFKIELESLREMKSKEQLAAEEAVKKAEQSLEAAKKTLQQIKEK